MIDYWVTNDGPRNNIIIIPVSYGNKMLILSQPTEVKMCRGIGKKNKPLCKYIDYTLLHI